MFVEKFNREYLWIDLLWLMAAGDQSVEKRDSLSGRQANELHEGILALLTEAMANVKSF